MDIIEPAIDRYLGRLARVDDPVLLEMEQLAHERSFPIVGPQVGRLLHLLARAVGARSVLELGSGFGYSAYWFARAVGPAGRVVLTEGSAARAAEAASFLERGGLAARVEILVGDAIELMRRVEGPFDVVFNDVDKEAYPDVLGPALGMLRPGGLFVSDNMLWLGKVLAQHPGEASTRGVQALTRQLTASAELETVLLPLRDGVSVSIYRPGPAHAPSPGATP